MKRSFWQSPNFWLALIILIGGFFIGFPVEAAESSVSAVFALIGGGGILFRFFKSNPGTQAKPWLSDANFWNYFATLFIAVAPEVATTITPALQETVQQFFRGNWGGAIMGLISLGTIIIKIIQSRATPAPVA